MLTIAVDSMNERGLAPLPALLCATDTGHFCQIGGDTADAVQISGPEADALTGELAEYLSWSMKEGLAPGDQGWWEDSVAFSGPWGFEFAQISVPVLVVHGREDKFVPFSHGEWLAGHVPGAEPWLLGNDGHVTLMANRIGEVHAWLADHMKG